MDQVRQRHRLLLKEDPLQVLHENIIVGDLLPNTMDSHPERIGTINRHIAIKSFGYLYCDRLRKMAETMTLEEVKDNVAYTWHDGGFTRYRVYDIRHLWDSKSFEDNA